MEEPSELLYTDDNDFEPEESGRSESEDEEIDDHESRPSEVLRQAADKLAAILSQARSAPSSAETLNSYDADESASSTVPPDDQGSARFLDDEEQDDADEMEALLDRKEDSSGEDSDWAEEAAANPATGNGGGRWRMERPHPHIFKDHHDEFTHPRPATSQTRLAELELKKRDLSPPAAVKPKRAATAGGTRSEGFVCRYYQGMPEPLFRGTDLMKYPMIDIAKPWILEERTKEVVRINRSLMLRLTNPWAETENRTVIKAYLAGPPPGKRLDQKPAKRPVSRPLSANSTKQRPLSAHVRPNAGPAYYNRLSTPRQIPQPSPYPVDFVPHPRRTAKSARPMSADRIQALSTRNRPPVHEEVVPSLHSGPRKLDPSVWDRLSVPRTRVVRKGSKQHSSNQSVRPSSNPTLTAKQPPRPRKIISPPKTSVLAGRYGVAAANEAEPVRESNLSTAVESDDEPDDGSVSGTHTLPHPSPPAPPPPRCDSIAETEDDTEEGEGLSGASIIAGRRISLEYQARRSVVRPTSRKASAISWQEGVEGNEAGERRGYVRSPSPSIEQVGTRDLNVQDGSGYRERSQERTDTESHPGQSDVYTGSKADLVQAAAQPLPAS
ncbi:hypothetical protein HKX48_007818, partial [Thoreauomyces humboldtii]